MGADLCVTVEVGAKGMGGFTVASGLLLQLLYLALLHLHHV